MELERLFDHDARRDRVARVIQAATRLELPLEPVWPGRRLGAYRIVREIGRGGMGTVFEAVRDDDEFRKRVALKVATRGSYSDSFRERFRHERQILAQLEHSYVARLLDGGTTPEGIPFFAMEFVEGKPISDYCSELKGIRPKVELFLKVCAAVDFAHQHLVIHRDLKPSNILVDMAGDPKLLDFGIAKLLTPSAEDATRTETGFAPITPDYCSPEQIRGNAITTRTDVYSLGLILFEILCGERGQAADLSTPMCLDQSICEVPIPLPSARTKARNDHSLARSLRGDLDTIVLTAAQKDPARRYPSVAKLSEDLRRYLDGMPVLARRDSTRYRITKYARRNWLPLGAAALIAMTLVGGIVSTRYQARQSAKRFDQVRGLARAMMFEVHDAVRLLPNSRDAQDVVVRTAVGYLDTLSRDAAGDAGLLQELASGYVRIGEILGDPLRPSQGKDEEAVHIYHKAVELMEPLNRRDPAASGPAVPLSEAYIGIADHLGDSGSSGEARRYIEAAVRVMEGPVARYPDDEAALRGLAIALLTITREGHSINLVADARRLVSLSELLAHRFPEDRVLRKNLAAGYAVAGGALARTGFAGEALPWVEKAVAINEASSIEQPNDAHTRRNLMLAYAKLGDLRSGAFGGTVDRPRALEALQKMAAEAEWLYKADPKNRTVRMDYAMSLMRLGDVLPPGDVGALAILSRSAGLMKELSATDAKTSGVLATRRVDLSLRTAARLQMTGKPEAAMNELRNAIQLGGNLAKADPNDVAARLLLVRAYMSMGREVAGRRQPGEARGIITKVDRLVSELTVLRPGDADTLAWRPRTASWTAEIHRLLGDTVSAETFAQRGKTEWRELASIGRLPDRVAAERENALKH